MFVFNINEKTDTSRDTANACKVRCYLNGFFGPKINDQVARVPKVPMEPVSFAKMEPFSFESSRFLLISEKYHVSPPFILFWVGSSKSCRVKTSG